MVCKGDAKMRNATSKWMGVQEGQSGVVEEDLATVFTVPLTTSFATLIHYKKLFSLPEVVLFFCNITKFNWEEIAMI